MHVFLNLTNTIKKLNVHSALAFAGMAGPVVLIVTDIVASSANPGYSPVRDSISSLALYKLGWVQTIGFLAIGLLIEIFTAGLLYNIRARRGFHLSIACLVIAGFGMLLLGAFRTEPTGSPETTDGIIHSVAALVVFWLFPIACLIITPSIKKDPHWQNVYKYTIITGVIGFILVIIVITLEDTAAWFGLAERLLVANMIIWVEVMAFKLLYLSVTRNDA
jgi:uncharacterized membrane protein